MSKTSDNTLEENVKVNYTYHFPKKQKTFRGSLKDLPDWLDENGFKYYAK